MPAPPIHPSAGLAHSHGASDINGLDAAIGNHNHDELYSALDHDHDADYAALSHTHSIANVTSLQTSLDGKSATGHNHAGVYEPADAAIQTHVQAAHAPSNAQKNSDITKAEIEAKLTGEISSHSHAGGPGGEAFPVGSVFIAVVDDDPADLLGYGTWAAFGAGRVLIGVNAADPDFDTVEETGGAKTVQSAGTVSQPTFAGNALGTHAHAAGTLVPSAHAGTAVADHASHTHTYTEVPNHVHGVSTILRTATTGGATTQVTNAQDTSSTADTTRKTDNPDGGVATGTTAGPSATLTHNVTQPSNHTMSGSSEAVSAGTPAGTVSQPTFTGSATSVVQPYITCYFWKRTA